MLIRLIFLILAISSAPVWGKYLSTADGNSNIPALSHQISNKSVVIYEGKRQLGKFNNLIVDESSLSSEVVRTLGGKLAIYVDSNGSRNKFHLVIPIHYKNNELFTQCVYKTVYDSVDEKRLVGASCEHQRLDKFNLTSVISEKNLSIYKPDYDWLASLLLPRCENPVGFVYGDYHVVRCEKRGDDMPNAFSTAVFKKSGELIFSIDGYDFFPGNNNNDFALTSDTSSGTVFFKGSLDCFSDLMRVDSSAKAKMGVDLKIRYSIGRKSDCYGGAYSYVKNGVPIKLTGKVTDNIYYLMEQGNNKDSTGLFILDKLDTGMRGIWIGTKLKNDLPVR